MYCTPLEKRMQRLMKRVFALLLACLMLCSSVDLPLVFASADGEDPVDPTGNTTETTIETTTEVTSESTTVTTTETTQSTSETTKETTQETTKETTQETTKETTQETTKETVTETTTEDTSGTTAQTTTETTTAPSTQAPANGISDDDLTSTGETDPQTGDVNISQYASDLYIYNYNRCSASGTGESIPFNGKLTGTTSEKNVFVGDKADASGEDAPIATDIPLSVDNLHLQGTSMTINPVYHGSYQVHMTVAAVSSISNLVLNESAKLTITLNADLSVENLNLATGSSLTIHTKGHTLTISGVTSGSGSLTIDGAGGVNVSEQLNAGTMSVNGATLTTGGIFCDGTMTLTDATVAANNGRITAAGDITVSGGSISNASLFGYGADASGNRTITLSNAVNFSDVAVVGAAMDCPVQVTLAEGSSYNVASSTYFTWDYPICYYVGAEVVVAEAGWPVVYRSQNETFAGYFVSGDAFTKTDRVNLPTPVLNGFTFGGWKLNNAGDIVAQLTGAAKGPLSYHAQVEAKDVTVNYDLTFTPSTDNTDDPNDAAYQLPQVVKKLGETVNLTNPYQFGYEFQGWTPDGGTTVYKDSYTLSYQDVTAGETITLKAVFSPVSFPVQVQIPSVAVGNLQIRNSSEAEWVSPAVFDEAYNAISWDNNLRYFQIDAQIAYGESLAAFFTRTMGGYPQVQDINAVRAERQVFGGWATFQNTTKVSPETLCNLASGILEGRGDKTLSQFQTYLASEGIKLLAQWRDTAYTITTDTSSAWKIYLGDAKDPAVPDANGQLKDVPAGTLLTWECSINDAMGISNWRFASVDEGKNQSAYNQMVQQTVAAGEQVVRFTMTMPADDLYAACRYGKTGTKGTEAMGLSGEGEEQIYVNLTNGSVTFAEGVTHKGLTKNGFWYAQPLSEMNHWFQDADGRCFYTWDSSKTFGVTTSAPTSTNKLTLINSMTVKLKNVQLTATDDFATKAGGKKINGVDAQANSLDGTNLTSYANIILDNSRYNKYTPKLIFEGTSTVAAIMPSVMRVSTDYIQEVYLSGQNGAVLTLGTLFGNHNIYINDLSINQYDTTFKLLLHARRGIDNGTYKVTNCTINAPDKEIYASNGNYTFTDSNVRLYSHYVGAHVYYSGNTYARYYGSTHSSYGNVNVSGTSSLVVDGNILKGSSHWSTTESINTDGYVIVKGNRIDFGTGSIKRGTVITNALVFGRTASISGGKVITNLITNNPALWPVYNATTETYTFNGAGASSAANQNGDNYPFLTYSQNDSNEGVYSFTGGNIYLAGYYAASGQTYDASIILADANGTLNGANPVSAVLNGMLDENGDLIPNASLGVAPESIISSTYVGNECFVLGNSSYDENNNKIRTVLINGANIQAAGNLTFLNDTEIRKGTVTAGGNITSKQGLLISGGTVTAKTVGNSYNLKESAGTGLYRWQTTTITGGTVTVDKLGIAADTYRDSMPNRSTIVISGNPVINAKSVTQDIYVNYIFDNNFTHAKTPENLRFTGNWQDQAISIHDLSLNLTAIDNVSTSEGHAFVLPKVKADNSEGSWVLDNDPSKIIEKITADSKAVSKKDGEETVVEEKVFDRVHMDLSAVKGSYALTLKALENSTVSVTVDNTATEMDAVGDTENARPGASVTIQLDNSAMANKTVVWYYDGNGVIHNALTEQSISGNTISFIMPYADVEIWISESITLDLYRNPVSLFNGGFAVEYNRTDREDSSFDYRGNVTIEKSDSSYTKNQIKVEDDFTNASGAPSITLQNVKQTGTAYDNGILLEDGSDIIFNISGEVELHLVHVPYNANFTAQGNDRTTDSVMFRILTTTGGSTTALGNRNGKVGNISLRNLTIKTYTNGNLGYGSSKSDRSVYYENCTLYDSDYYHASVLASNVENLTFNNCKIYLKGITSWPGRPFSLVKNVVLTDTEFTYYYGCSSTHANSFFNTDQNDSVLTINGNSKLKVGVNNTTGSANQETRNTTSIFSQVIMNGGSVEVDHRLQLRTLVMNGGQLTVKSIEGTTGDEGYLLCSDIDMNGGVINAAYVVLSGYYAPTGGTGGPLTKTEFLSYMANGINVQKSGTLTMTGGTINASHFLGGDQNATLNISGGEVTSERIGTYGALFGYTRYIPKVGEEYVYKYTQNIPQGTKVNISGGEVNVTEGGYLGGWGTDVNITGGEVDVANNAVLGLRDETVTTYVNRAQKLDGAIAVDITDDARITGSGSISTPGNDTTISGNSAVKIGNILAKDGNINISTTNKSFDLGTQFQAPYNKAGVDVLGTIKAQNVTISGGAVVYANEAYVESGDKGVLTVKGNNHLCIGTSYGVMGAGNVTIDTGTDDVTTNIHLGNRVYKIYYDLNDTEDDPATEGAGNPTSYNPADGVTVALTPPTRKRFNFKGWKNEQGNLIANDTLHLNAGEDMTLTATWEPKEVTFRIAINTDVLTNNFDAETAGKAGETKTVDGKETFIFTQPLTIAYQEPIVIPDASVYNLVSFGITALKIGDAGYTGDRGVSLNQTKVSAQLMDYFLSLPDGGYVTLLADAALPRFREVTLSLNQKGGRPVDAQFVNGKKAAVAATVELNAKLSSTHDLLGDDGELLKAVATGYTFGGWYGNEDCTGSPITKDYQVTQSSNVNFFAKWTANEYQICFDAGDGGVIDNGTDQKKQVAITYDQIIAKDMDLAQETLPDLPEAHKDGMIFKGWRAADDQPIITTSTELNKTAFGMMNLAATPSLTLYAVYEPVTVHYQLNGGSWKAQVNTQPSYDEALAGYTKAEGEYQIISTDAEYFANNKQYVANDYRHTLIRKGYTFGGWYTDEACTQEMQTIPQNPTEDQETITLYAKWTPNTYTLILNDNSAKNTYAEYGKKDGNVPANDSNVSVTVEKVIGNETNWPERDEWYAYNKGSEGQDKRLLLGFTFFSLEPGETSNNSVGSPYYQYGEAVKIITNNNALMTKTENASADSGATSSIGSTFGLPADGAFAEIKQITGDVPDYPNDSTITMYAVYRERSLVFIERLTLVEDNKETKIEQVLHFARWDQYSDFPKTYSPNYPGYSLLGWYVNDTTEQYPADTSTYTSKYEQYAKEAQLKGSYDIKVYTRFAAQDTVKNYHLQASSDPTKTNGSPVSYILPGSMQQGVPNYKLTGFDGLNIVGEAEISKHRYDSQWPNDGRTYSADDTVAIKAELIDSGNTVKQTVWLTKQDEATDFGGLNISKGWKIQLTLYHSSVMTEAAKKNIKGNLELTFPSIQNQKITFQDLQISLTPSMYTVYFKGELAQPDDQIQKSDWTLTEGFVLAANNLPAMAKQMAYGSKLPTAEETPVLLGYQSDGKWTCGNAGTTTAVDYGGNLTYPVSGSGAINLSTTYTISSYNLSVDTKILDAWDVKVGEQEVKNDSPIDVTYRTLITFTPKSNTSYPEFIMLKELGLRLDAYEKATNADGTYTFTMPATDVTAKYSDVMELDLAKDNIYIDQDSFFYQGKERTWNGKYRIIQSADTTANTLTLEGDLGERVALDKLNITASNSIYLTSGSATLIQNDSLTVANIAVGSGAQLVVNGNGKPMHLNLAAGSSIPGIGSAAGGANTSVTLNGCNVSVKQYVESGTGGYNGTWIGGNGIDVTVKNSTIQEAAGSATSAVSTALAGNKVIIEGSCIGTETGAITSKISAVEKLEIKKSGTTQSQIHMQLSAGPALVASGAAGEIQIGDATVVNANLNTGTDLYRGTMKILSAEADVVIANTQILEMKNGAITIEADQVTQDPGITGFVKVIHNHSGAYLLLNELDNAVEDVTINAGTSNPTITVDEKVSLDTLSAKTDAKLNPQGLLTVKKVTIAEAATLTVTAEENAGLEPEAFGGDGSYSQTGGKLEAETDLVVGGNMALDDVTVTASGKPVGSSGKSGVTTVSIEGSNITAQTIGAIGAQNDTFTFVTLEGTNTLNGTLVQDHYRLAYVLEDANFKKEDGIPLDASGNKLPTVLRSSTVYTSGIAGTAEYAPSVPGDPKYQGTGTSYFGVWYYEENNTKIAVSTAASEPGFTRVDTLDASTIACAEDTDSADATKTLTLNAQMSVYGTGTIASGRLLNGTGSFGTTANIPTTGAWTAKFQVEGALVGNFQFTFDQALPAGTQLTLVHMHGGNTKFYYHSGGGSTVSFTAFKQMGGTAAPDLGETGSVLDDTFLLTADFSRSTAPTGGKVTLQVTSGSSAMDVASVNYTVSGNYVGTVMATETAVTASFQPNGDTRLSGKKLYLVAELNTSVPYGAEATLTSGNETKTAKWLGGNLAVFEVGTCGLDESTYNGTWQITGMDASYNVTWHLTASDNADNVFHKLLASANSISMAGTAEAEPSLAVTLDASVTSRVFTAGAERRVSFRYETNAQNVTASVEKQGTLAQFTTLPNAAVSAANGLATATIPAEVGTYRVCFSLNENSKNDNVYFTFIVEAAG